MFTHLPWRVSGATAAAEGAQSGLQPVPTLLCGQALKPGERLEAEPSSGEVTTPSRLRGFPLHSEVMETSRAGPDGKSAATSLVLDQVLHGKRRPDLWREATSHF